MNSSCITSRPGHISLLIDQMSKNYFYDKQSGYGLYFLHTLSFEDEKSDHIIAVQTL